MTIAPEKLTTTLELGDKVSHYMETTYPYTEVEGGWVCLRDERDGSVAIVWRVASELLNTPGIRGNVLYKWMCSLRDVGFTVEPRLDMEIYGRPDEESPDGRAQWLHVTGWSEPAPPKPPIQLFTFRQHHVQLVPDANPAMDDVCRKDIRPDLACFAYHPDGKYGGITVAVYVGEKGHPVGDGRVPAWLWAIGEAHQGCRTSWCYLEAHADKVGLLTEAGESR